MVTIFNRRIWACLLLMALMLVGGPSGAMQSVLQAVSINPAPTTADNYTPVQGTSGAPTTTETQTEQLVAIGGRFSNFWVKVATAPGSGTWDVTLRVNEASTALTVHLSGASTVISDTTHTVSASPGDRVCLLWHPSTTPAPTAIGAVVTWGCVFTGTTAGESLVMQSRGLVQTASTTTYYDIHGDGAGNTTEASAYSVMPTAGILDNLYVGIDSALAGSETFTLRVNGVDQSLTVTLTAGNLTGNDLASGHSVTVAQGDTVSLKVVTPAGATARIHSGMRFKPTVDGESCAIMSHNSSITAGVTGYRFFGHSNLDTTEANRSAIIPIACTIRKLYVLANTLPNGETLVSTMRKTLAAGGSSDTAMTCTITGNAGTTNVSASDNTHNYTVAAGDLITWKGVASAATGTLVMGGGVVYYIPPGLNFRRGTGGRGGSRSSSGAYLLSPSISDYLAYTEAREDLPLCYAR